MIKGYEATDFYNALIPLEKGESASDEQVKQR